MGQKSTLLTGGAGFIGSHLTEALLAAGHKVVVADDLSTGHQSNLPKHANLTFTNCDVNSPALAELFTQHNFDWVFHYAAVVGVKRTLEHPASVMRDLEGMRQIMELARKHGVDKVLFASSSEVYGEPLELPEREDGPTNAKLPYAVVKLAGEKYLEAYHQEFGMRTTALRLFNVYGPRQIDTAYGFVVGIFLKQMLSGKPPTVFGDGTQTRDFVYVKDNVAATLKAMEAKTTDGEVVNLGTGKHLTIAQLAEAVIKTCGAALKPQFLPARPNDIMQRYPEVTKFRKLLDYQFRYSLEEGLRETMEWMRHAQ